MHKAMLVGLAFIAFTMWEAPDGKWTRQGKGSSESQSDAYSTAMQYCREGTETVRVMPEGARVFVVCEPK